MHIGKVAIAAKEPSKKKPPEVTVMSGVCRDGSNALFNQPIENWTD
jgi:hypothetical protein